MKKIVEEWRTIEEFPDYEISNYGKCRNTKSSIKNLIKKEQRTPTGRPIYALFRKGHRRQLSPGVLVAGAFVDNPNGWGYVKHKDGDLFNNFYQNLEWHKSPISAWIPEEKKALFPGSRRRCPMDKEKQIEILEKHMIWLLEWKKAFQNDEPAAFLYKHIIPFCKDLIRRDFKPSLREEALEFMKERALQDILSGIPLQYNLYIFYRYEKLAYLDYRKKTALIYSDGIVTRFTDKNEDETELA